ncbi:MAG: YceH family protein [Thermoleophilaceae bacterium]|nr:YceH family protein [Thermoleophilaceae bacterium]
MEPDAAEIRVLGCLIEKQRTTPDVYPLTLNALRLACNQSTNREPVVEYDESTIRAALERLGRRKWTTLASWSNRRAMKYRHTLDSALGLSDAELALLCVLMLRGAQTPGELKQRSERLHPFAGPHEVEETLRGLIDRELVAQLPRRPGQREERYVQLLGASADGEPVAEPAPAPPVPSADGLEARVARLENDVASLRTELRVLREDLGGG